MADSESPNETRAAILARTRRILNMMEAHAESHKGGMRVDSGPNEVTAIVAVVSFGLVADGPLMQGLLYDGELYVNGRDAGTIDGRNRQRMQAIARRVQDA